MVNGSTGFQGWMIRAFKRNLPLAIWIWICRFAAIVFVLDCFIFHPWVIIGFRARERGVDRVRAGFLLVPENFILVPPASFVIKDSDILIMLGKNEDVRRIKALK